jgi:hypothetical protein
MGKKIALFALALIVAGCASQPMSDAEREEALAPLVCQGKPQCDFYMQRATAWVALNSHWRIQIANETVVQSIYLGGRETWLSYQVVREPRADGSAKITVIANCGKEYGCQPDPLWGILELKRYVLAR